MGSISGPPWLLQDLYRKEQIDITTSQPKQSFLEKSVSIWIDYHSILTFLFLPNHINENFIL